MASARLSTLHTLSTSSMLPAMNASAGTGARITRAGALCFVEITLVVMAVGFGVGGSRASREATAVSVRYTALCEGQALHRPSYQNFFAAVLAENGSSRSLSFLTTP